jgi:hypothetical protein
MHLPINVKSPNNISKWQMEFNSAFKGLIGTRLCLNYYCLKYTVFQFCVMGRSIRSRKISIQSSNCNVHVCRNTVRFSLIMPHQPQNLPKISTSCMNQQSCITMNYAERLTNFCSRTSLLAVWLHTNPASKVISLSVSSLQFNLAFFLFFPMG